MKTKTQLSKTLGCSQVIMREVYSIADFPQEGRKDSNTQLNLTPKGPGKKQPMKPKTIIKREIIMVTAEINDREIKNKNWQNRSMKLGAGSLKDLTKLLNPQ